MSRKKRPICQIESKSTREEVLVNSNEEVFIDDEENIDVNKSNLSFTPTFSKLNIQSDERPESPGDTMVLGSEESEDEGQKEELDGSFNSSADTVLLSQNSSQRQSPLEMEVPVGDTQILDQSSPQSPHTQPLPLSLAKDQNSNNAEKRNHNTKVKNSGAVYWMNELIKSRSKPKKLDIEDPDFPFCSSLKTTMEVKINQNPEETMKEFRGGISLSDKIAKTGLRHQAKLNRGQDWIKLKKKNKNQFLDKLLGVDGDDQPKPGPSKAGKRRRPSSSEEDIPGHSPISPTSPVSSRSKRRNRNDTEDDSFKRRKLSSPDQATPNTSQAKGKKEEKPMGTCPLCMKSMKMTVLERHAAECQGVVVTRKSNVTVNYSESPEF